MILCLQKEALLLVMTILLRFTPSYIIMADNACTTINTPKGCSVILLKLVKILLKNDSSVTSVTNFSDQRVLFGVVLVGIPE